jgi:WD40 repeat protein
VIGVALSPDATLLAAAGGLDGTVDLWRVATGEKWATLQAPDVRSPFIQSIVFSPNGTTLAGAGAWEIHRWETATCRRLRVTDQPDMGSCRVAVSPYGTTLATACCRQELLLWETRTGRLLGLRGKHPGCSWVAFSPAGSLLASGVAPAHGLQDRVSAKDRVVHLWHVNTGEEVGQIPGADVAVFSPAGRFLAAAWSGGTVSLWDLATTQKVWETPLDGYATKLSSLTFSADGKLLAWAAGEDMAALDFQKGSGLPEPPCVVVREVASGAPPRRLTCPEPCWGVAFAPDGRTLAAVGAGAVWFWETRSWQQLRQTEPAPAVPAGFRRDPVRALAFSPDSTTLAAETSSHGIGLWEVATGRLRRTLAGHRAKILSLAFTPDGRSLVSGSDDTTALVWDLAPAEAADLRTEPDRPPRNR